MKHFVSRNVHNLNDPAGTRMISTLIRTHKVWNNKITKQHGRACIHF